MFADEPNHYSRKFAAAWPATGESATSIANKIQQLLRRLALIDSAYGEIRPILKSRPLRRGDPGGLEMSVSEFAELIDQNTRFDPPQFPAPVGMDGYSMALGPDRSTSDPRYLSLIIRAGQYRSGAWDDVELQVNNDSSIWREIGAGVSVLDILIDVLGCTRASARAFVWVDVDKSWSRPWMTWVADTATSSLPFPFAFPAAPPAERRARHRDGELCIWP